MLLRPARIDFTSLPVSMMPASKTSPIRKLNRAFRLSATSLYLGSVLAAIAVRDWQLWKADKRPGQSPAMTNSDSVQATIALVDQTRVHHRLAHRRLRLLARRHHRQPQRVGAFADQRHGVLDGSR